MRWSAMSGMQVRARRASARGLKSAWFLGQYASRGSPDENSARGVIILGVTSSDKPATAAATREQKRLRAATCLTRRDREKLVRICAHPESRGVSSSRWKPYSTSYPLGEISRGACDRVCEKRESLVDAPSEGEKSSATRKGGEKCASSPSLKRGARRNFLVKELH